MNNMTDISTQVIRARKMMNLDQVELARLTGISIQLIAELEEGRIDPPVSLISIIAKSLNCSFIIGDSTI